MTFLAPPFKWAEALQGDQWEMHENEREGAILFGSGENASGLDDVVSTDGAPRDLSGILLSENGDGFALDPEFAILGLNRSLEPSVDGIVLEHVDL